MIGARSRWRLRAYFAPILMFAGALSLLRGYLYLKYVQLFIAEPSAVALAFLSGVRFDISIGFIISLPFILLAALPRTPAAGRLMAPLLYVLLFWQVGLLGYQFIDVHFYADTQRRLSYDILYAWQSVGVVTKMGFTGFMLDTLAMITALVAYIAAYRRWVIIPVRKAMAQATAEAPVDGATAAGWLTETGSFLLVALVTVIAVRGGVQFKPLGVSHAFMSANEAMGNLSLNGVFTTYQALYDFSREGGGVAANVTLTDREKSETLQVIVGTDEAPVDLEYPLYRRFAAPDGRARGMNVVLIIMESWTAKYLGAYGGAVSGGPFFDKLAEESLLLNNCFANAQRTFEGFLAVMGSFPTWNPIIAGAGGLSFQTRLHPVGSVFAAMDYETLFIHGGEADSMGFHKLVRRLGFSRHISLDDFQRTDKTYDGIWGIYDEAVFERANQEYSQMKEPFFSVIMSLSSHLPFRLPSGEFDKYRQFPSPKSDFLNSMGYSDYALSRFFELAKKSDYYHNTLFVITADHTARYFSNHNMRESYQIPCLFHAPRLGLSGRKETLASQFDLIPTILDLIGSTEPYTAWGKSVFGKGPRATTLPRDSRSRVFVSGGYMLLADMERVYGLYDMATGAEVERKNDVGRVGEKLHWWMRAYIGMSERMIMDNKVAPPRIQALQPSHSGNRDN
ncbi:MAG: sulfatase-like hydrolase/transferase [Nitrospinota bacterium]|nr:sulfatase-like hydrolase/transferase [Nitrospinota bacterium]